MPELQYQLLGIEMHYPAADGFRIGVRLNDLDENVRVLQRAVAAKSREIVTMTNHEGRQAMSKIVTEDNAHLLDQDESWQTTLQTKTVALDDEIHTFHDVLKFSIHGAEALAIDGLQKTLRRKDAGVLILDPHFTCERDDFQGCHRVRFVENIIKHGYECHMHVQNNRDSFNAGWSINITQNVDYFVEYTNRTFQHGGSTYHAFCLLQEPAEGADGVVKARVRFLREIVFENLLAGLSEESRKYDKDDSTRQDLIDKVLELSQVYRADGVWHPNADISEEMSKVTATGRMAISQFPELEVPEDFILQNPGLGWANSAGS